MYMQCMHTYMLTRKGVYDALFTKVSRPLTSFDDVYYYIEKINGQ